MATSFSGMLTKFLDAFSPDVRQMEDQGHSQDRIKEELLRTKIEMSLPMFTAEQLNLTVNNEHLVISGIKPANALANSVGEFASFTKSYPIPGSVNVREITAHFTQGKLVIELPKGTGDSLIARTITIN